MDNYNTHEEISGYAFFKKKAETHLQNCWAEKYSINTEPVHVVVDTDAGSEIDDQFALAYLFSLLEEKNAVVEGIYAAPFREGLPRDPSVCEPLAFDEITRVLQIASQSNGNTIGTIPVFHGSTRYLWQAEDGSDAHKDCRYDRGLWSDEGFQPKAVVSPASKHLVETAKLFSPEKPLWVICIGALTNIASALLLDPAIADNVKILYLGGNRLQDNILDEFNVAQDPIAFALLESAPYSLRFPCTGCCDALGISIKELSETLSKIGGPLNQYLAQINDKRLELRKKNEKDPKITVLWDVAPIAFLFHPEWFTLAADGRTAEKLQGKTILDDVFAHYANTQKN